MRVLLLLSAIATAQFCFPPSCRIDANCYDSINNQNAKCCGGKCVLANSIPTRLAGESCDIAGSFESCRGSCAPGLYCSTVDEKCHSQTVLCNCTTTAECLSGTCALANANATQKTCRPASTYSLPVGMACDSNFQCQTEFCNNVTNVCDFKSVGASCSPSVQTTCGPNASCVLDTGLYRCKALCATNESNCCSTDTSCVDPADSCYLGKNRTCFPSPGAGENCTVRCNSSALVCGDTCNGTACISPSICQPFNQLALGNVCSVASQCPVNASCVYNSTLLDYVCIGDIPLGGQCSNANNCRAPGTLCSYNNGTQICKAVGATPVGAVCNSLTPSECATGSQCSFDSGAGSYICVALLALGANCTTSGVPCNNSGVCVPPAITGSCTIASQGCTCAASNSVADGGACTSSLQCSPSSACPSGTCVPMQGKSCNTTSDCASSKFKCNCNRQCNAVPPTPLPAPTPAPTTCQAQKDAVRTNFFWSGGVTGLVSSSVSGFLTGSNAFIPQVMDLGLQQQRSVLALACCVTCPYNQRFNSLGFQVDCGNFTLTVFPPACNRTELAFLNCWKSVTSSATAFSGVGLMAMLAAGFLL